MAVVEVACPHCGRETNGTTATGSQLVGVHKDYSGSNSSVDYSENTCQQCGSSFYTYYESN